MRPTSAAMRGGGASATARPGTATRLGTGMRLATGAAAAGGMMGAVAPLADMSITDRPVTQQGMMGMRVKTAGLGRQVADASYFVGLVRARITDISSEITRMKTDMEKSTKESGLMAQLERKYDVLVKEVRSLEGDLADYNLSMDKSRTSTVRRCAAAMNEAMFNATVRSYVQDASEIMSYHTALRRRNEAVAREVDAIFMERQERERGAHRLEEQIEELHRAAEARLNSLPPASIAEYRALADENRVLAGDVQAMQSELEQLNAHVEAAESELRRDVVRDEYAIMEKRLAHLRREKAALDEEKATTRLDPMEARDRLLAKVKEDNARIQALDRELKALEEANAAKKKTSSEITSELEERRNEAGDRDKYEVLFKRDQEMTEFIDRFPELRDKELAEQRRLQDVIVALLDHISEGLEREKVMPSKEQAEEMKEDLGDKNRELKASQMTQERLQEELSLRQAELEKISSLDVKIAAELKSLEERMVQMQEEMRRYADIDGLKATAVRVREDLEKRTAEYVRRRDLLRQQVQLLASEHDRKRSAVAKEPQHAALEALETKLKTQEQAVFTLSDFLASKARETDYASAKAEALRLTAEINICVQQAQLAMHEAAISGIASSALNRV